MNRELNVRSVRPGWDKVMQEMLLVDLHVGRWRAKSRTKWEQLGLPREAFDKAYTPGARKLLPDHIDLELKRLEALARDLLDRMSYKTLFGRMLPKRKYFEWREMMTEMPLSEVRKNVYGAGIPKVSDDPDIQQIVIEAWRTTPLVERWRQLAREIAYNRDVIVDEVAAMYEDALEDIYRRQNNIAPDDPLGANYFYWLDDKKALAVESIPDADYIRESFVMWWELAEVEASPELLKEAKIEALELKEAELKRAIKRAKSEEERARFEREQQQVELDRAIAEEIARTRQEAGDRFEEAIDQIVGQLQGEIYTMILDQLENIDERGALHSRSIGRINNLVDLVRSKLVGLTNDDELRRACDELETLAASGNMSKEDQAGQVTAKLRNIAISMKADLVLANVPSRSGREFGIPDEPSVDLVRKARRLDTNTEQTELPELKREARKLEGKGA